MDHESRKRAHALAFPARFTSGRPAFAVTQPFLFAYAVRMSIAVHTSAFSLSFCCCWASGGRMPARHVRLSSAGGAASDGCASPRIFSSGSRDATWWMHRGIADTREMGRIPLRT